jgi:hypothetical protein
MATIDVSQTNHAYTPEAIRQIRGYSHSPINGNKPSMGLKNTLNINLRISPTVGRDLAEHLKSRISKINKLGDNWDGYGAIRPNKKTINQANAFLSGLHLSILQYLNEEDISPTPYGTIVMDFYRGNNRLSIEFGESKIGFFSEFVNNQNVESEGVKFDRTKLPNELQKAIDLFLRA